MSVIVTQPNVGGRPAGARGVDAPREPTGRAVGEFAFVAIQFALLLLVVQRYQIETAGFRSVFALCVGAFFINHWLPRRLRMGFFLAVSVASVLVVFGMDRGDWLASAAAERGGWLLGIVGAVIGACYLPLAFVWRVAIIAGLGAVLTALRAGALSSPIPPAIWPIVGSMLMFRVLILLYDLGHGSRPGAVASMSYATMAPNVCFPLFPVVDLKTFCRTHFDAPSLRIYQVGLGWILRGIVQLLIYRELYYNWHIDAGKVATGRDVAQFLLVNFLLYLRVSGQFHIIVGLLHLFGFNLPETHRRYYLASSFTDYWRRINIYWKDFIMKLFYYPIVFRLKKLPQSYAMAIATLLAFLATWALHSYQYFWLRGTFPVVARDIVFWGALAVLVTVNSIWEARRGRRRTLNGGSRSARDVVVRGLKTAGTFLAICLLWSIWTSRSISQWLDVLSRSDATTAGIGLGVLAVVFAVSAIPEGWWVASPSARPRAALDRLSAASVRRAVLTCLLPACLLAGASVSRIHGRFGDGVASFMRELASETKPVEGDIEELQRGYYEDLIDIGLVNSPLAEVFMKRPANWVRHLDDTPVARPSGDYRMTELVPNATATVNGIEYRINRWGMRDRDYSLERPSGVYRIALVGASQTMGWGATQDAVFESVVEARLESERPSDRPGIEILNFSVNGYSPVCQVIMLEKQVLRFQPSAVFYVAHEMDEHWTVSRLARAIRAQREPPWQSLGRVAAECGARPMMAQEVLERRLKPRALELVESAYRRIVETCRTAGVPAVWVYVPRPGEAREGGPAYAGLRRAAEEAGFEMMDLRGVYGATPDDEIIAAPWDRHPNDAGHRILAEGFHEALGAHLLRTGQR